MRLARNPKLRMRTKPSGSRCKRKWCEEFIHRYGPVNFSFVVVAESRQRKVTWPSAKETKPTPSTEASSWSSNHWNSLEVHMKLSPYSSTRLEYDPALDPALKKVGDFDADRNGATNTISNHRSLCPKGRPLSFYHSLYTHSIPWALHGKDNAKANRQNPAPIANSIDTALRNTQDQQTLGIPVGPVTSDLLSELLGNGLGPGVSISCIQLTGASVRLLLLPLFQ